MNRRGVSLTAAVIAVAAVASGCQSSGSASESSPTPTPTLSSVSATPTPTPSAGAVSKAEAEKVYRTLQANVFALEKAGGLVPGEPAPKALTDYASGSALDDYMAYMHQVAAVGWKWKSGDSTVTAVREKKDDTNHPEAAIALESCEDGSSIRSVDRHGKADTGRIVHMDSWYARDKAGTVKQIAFHSVEVKSCDVK